MSEFDMGSYANLKCALCDGITWIVQPIHDQDGPRIGLECANEKCGYFVMMVVSVEMGVY